MTSVLDLLDGASLFKTAFVLFALSVIAVGLVIATKSVRQILAVHKLNRDGIRVSGRVVEAELIEKRVYFTYGGEVGTTGGDAIDPYQMSETIEFQTTLGEVVQGTPRASDIGTQDRSGTNVTVLYNTADSQSFLAPGRGDKFNTWKIVSPLIVGLVFCAAGALLALVGGFVLR